MKAIVADAAELPTGERAALVIRACAGDAELRAEVERLLSNLDNNSGSAILPVRPREHSLEPDDILGERFRIVRFLGAGGMGEVYEAADLELGGALALKILRGDRNAEPQFAARFRREVQIARKVTHPNICRIFDVGNDRGRLFLTMELLDGETLAQKLRRGGKLSCEEALPILRQMAAGLDALHQSGVVHRDFKPGNVMLRDDGKRVVINDFGLARVVEGQQSTLTNLSRTGQVMGTPAYMSPEQLMGAEARAASDVYALGLVMYEMVTGARAFPGGGALETAVQRVVETPPPPKNVPAIWEAVIMQCLEREPAKRPASAGAVVAALTGESIEHTWGPLRLDHPLGPDAYLAFDKTLGREVTLQFLRAPDDAEDQTEIQTQTMIREVRDRARVRHPNLLPIHGVDLHDGRVGFWSDHVRGKTLAEWLKLQGPFSPRETAAIGADLAYATGAIHAAGLVHGQVTAANIIREDGGRILLGFMQAPLREHESAGPAPLDDIHAIGAVLFELLTGAAPGAGAGGPHLAELRPDAPADLARAVEKALDPDPRKRFQSAEALASALRTEAKLNPRRGPAWILIPAAAVLFGVGIFVPSVRKALPFEKASGAHASFLKAQDALDHYYRRRGAEQATELFQKTIAEDPQFALAYGGLARANFLQYWQLDDSKYLEPAFSAATRALALDPKLASVHVTLGMLYTQTSKNDLASQELNAALRLDSLNAEAYYAMAELYYRQGRGADVEPALRKAVDLAPTDWRFPDELGYFYVRQGKFDKGIELHRQAVQLAPDNPRGMTNLGLAYLRAGRLAESIDTYRKAIAIEPGYNRLTGLASALEQHGEGAAAAEAMKQALALNPNSYSTWGNLGSIYGSLPGHEADSSNALRKAIELGENLRKDRPRDASLLARLGSYYEQTHQPDKSVPLLRQAGALSGQDPQVLFLLAVAHELGGRREESLRAIESSLAHGLPFSRLTESRPLAKLAQDPALQKFAAQYKPRP